jgi:cell division transport system permease protein
MSILTAFVIAVALATSGIFAILILRAQESLDEYRAQVPIEAYFDPSISSQEAEQASDEKIKTSAEISSYLFVSKEQALKEYIERSDEDAERILGYNPFPAGVRLKLKDMTTGNAAKMKSLLAGVPGMKDIIFESKTLAELEKRNKTLLLLAYLIGGFLLVTSVAIVTATVRLATASRAEAIRTMKLLGAGRMMIATPYIIEAIFAGIIGGLIAYGLVLLFHSYALPSIAPELMTGISSLAQPWLLVVGAAVIGLVVGFAGSVFVAFRSAK